MLRLTGFILSLLMCLTAGPLAAAESCDTILTALKALPSSNGSAKSARFAKAADKQRRALAATESMARESGCNGLFRRGEAGCVALRDTIAKMKNNLAMLDSVAGPDVKSRRAELRAQAVAAGCDIPKTKKAVSVAAAGDGFNVPKGSYRTLCVRMCDGYFFPISWSVNRTGFAKDEALCKMRCPGAETQLYVHPTGSESETATSLKGDAYTALPNAWRYQSAIQPDCGCANASIAPIPSGDGGERADPAKADADPTIWIKDGAKLKLRQVGTELVLSP